MLVLASFMRHVSSFMKGGSNIKRSLTCKGVLKLVLNRLLPNLNNINVRFYNMEHLC